MGYRKIGALRLRFFVYIVQNGQKEDKNSNKFAYIKKKQYFCSRFAKKSRFADIADVFKSLK